MIRPDTAPNPVNGSSGSRRYDRRQTADILRRAIELSHRMTGPYDERLSRPDLEAIAAEVGVTPQALAVALAEGHAGVRAEPRLSARLVERIVGPREVWATGAATGATDSAEESTASLQHWLEVSHGLRTYRRSDGMVVANRRRGLVAAMGTGVRRMQGMGGLDGAREVRGAAGQVAHHQAVCVVADLGNRRVDAVAGGAAVTAAGSAVIGVMALLTTPLTLLGLPVGVGLGAVTARLLHRQTVRTYHHHLLSTAEAAARGDRPIHPVDSLLRHRLLRSTGPATR